MTRAEAVLPWFHSLRESLGAAYYMNGEMEEAERVFREDLEFNPGSGRALLGLFRTLLALGRTAEAEVVKHQFEEAWIDAEVTLSMEDL